MNLKNFAYFRNPLPAKISKTDIFQEEGYKMAVESLLSKYRSEIMGAAALGVILCHAVTSDVQLPHIIVRLLVFFNLGVDVFLFVSGFGMYFSLSRAFEKKGVILWYKKRFVRILVPYALIMGPYWIGYCLFHSSGPDVFFYHFSTLSYWTEHIGVWYVAMLIPLYLTLPLFFALWRKSPYLMTVIYVLIAMIFGAFDFGSYDHYASVITNVQFCVMRIPAFWIGTLIGYTSEKYPHFYSRERYLLISVLSFLAYIVLSGFRYTESFCWYFLAALGLCSLFCYVGPVIEKLHPVRYFFNWLGARSLESYLTNYVCAHFFAVFSYTISGINLNAGNYLKYALVILGGLALTQFTYWLNAKIVMHKHLYI